jgi:hypothetical protein
LVAKLLAQLKLDLERQLTPDIEYLRSAGEDGLLAIFARGRVNASSGNSLLLDLLKRVDDQT